MDLVVELYKANLKDAAIAVESRRLDIAIRHIKRVIAECEHAGATYGAVYYEATRMLPIVEAAEKATAKAKFAAAQRNHCFAGILMQ